MYYQNIKILDKKLLRMSKLEEETKSCDKQLVSYYRKNSKPLRVQLGVDKTGKSFN